MCCGYTHGTIGATMGYLQSDHYTGGGITQTGYALSSYETETRTLYGNINSYVVTVKYGSAIEEVLHYAPGKDGSSNRQEIGSYEPSQKEQYEQEGYQAPNTVISGGAIREIELPNQNTRGQDTIRRTGYGIPLYDILRTTKIPQIYEGKATKRETNAAEPTEDIKDKDVMEQKRGLACLIRNELALFHISGNDNKNIMYN